MSHLIIGHPLSPNNQPSFTSSALVIEPHSRITKPTVSYVGEGNVLTIAPTGSRKTKDLLIPNVIASKNSSIVVDYDGFVFSNTAEQLIYKKDRRITIIDPFEQINVDLPKYQGVQRLRWNPLDDLPNIASEPEYSETFLLASLLGNSSIRRPQDDPFWLNAGRMFLSQLIILCQYTKNGKGTESSTFAEMLRLLFHEDPIYEIARTIDNYGRGIGDYAYNGLAAFLSNPDALRSSLLATVQSGVSSFRAKYIQDYLLDSEMSVCNLFAKEITTLYINIPKHHIVSSRKLLLMMFSILFDYLVRASRERKDKVTIFLDGIGEIGRLTGLSEVMGYSRSLPASFWLFCQDITQLQGNYGEAYSGIIANIDLFQTWGIRSRVAQRSLDSVMNIEDKEVWRALSNKNLQVVCLGTSDPIVLKLLDLAEGDRIDPDGAKNSLESAVDEIVAVETPSSPPENEIAPKFQMFEDKIGIGLSSFHLSTSEDQFLGIILQSDVKALIELCPISSNSLRRTREAALGVLEALGDASSEIDLNRLWMHARQLRQIDRVDRRRRDSGTEDDLVLDIEVSEALSMVVQSYNGFALGNDLLRRRDAVRDPAEASNMPVTSIDPIVKMIREESTLFRDEVMEMISGLREEAESDIINLASRGRVLVIETTENLISRAVAEGIREARGIDRPFRDSLKRATAEKVADGVLGLAKFGFRSLLTSYGGDLIAFTSQLPRAEVWARLLRSFMEKGGS